MKYVKLGEYCTVTSSKRVYANQYVEEGIPFYRAKEIIEKNSNKVITEKLYIDVGVYEEFKKKFGVPNKGDILLTSVGTLGVPYIVKDEQFYFKDGNLTWMKNFNSKLNSEYLYYWLSSNFGKQSIIQKAIGSSQGAITIEILKKYQIALPNIKKQKKIVKILKSYDELIENNNKRIKILEQMVEILYKEWFVKFRFPGYEQCEFENGMPKGWKIEKLKESCNMMYGYSFDSSLFTEEETDIPVVRIRDIPDNKTNTYTTEKCDEKYLIKDDDILVGMDGIFHMNIWKNGVAYLNQRNLKIQANANMSQYYLYFSLYPQIKYWEQTISGTTVAHLGEKHIDRIKIILPEKKILKKYNSFADNIMSEVKLLWKENQNLIQQRDLLLPRLMSGKLKIK